MGVMRAFCALAVSATIAGCSVHAIPEDVVGIPTHEIVAAIRCEMRLGFFRQVGQILEEKKIGGFDYRDLLEKESRDRVLPLETLESSNAGRAAASIIDTYASSAVAYDFDFEITENDGLSSNLAFQLPFPTPNLFNLKADGSLDKSRVGKRTFRSQQTFADIVKNLDWCSTYFGKRSKELPLPKNILYPISGSIGMDKVVESFMKLSDQGGGKDSFIDILTFTTTIGGSLHPSVTLSPVQHSFRLVSGSLDVSGSRKDVHKVTVSLAFPVKQKKAPTLYPDASDQSVRTRDPVWRARYNICVADARQREDAFKVLRDSPPEIYCMEYADAFVPATTLAAFDDEPIRDRGVRERRPPQQLREGRGADEPRPQARRRLPTVDRPHRLREWW